jgi:hypothetical protein
MSWLVPRALALIQRVMLAISEHREVLGVRVYVFLRDEDASEQVFTRVSDALHRLRQVDDRRLVRLRKDLRLIWVRRLFGVLGQFNPTLAACELDENYVLRPATTPEILASTIVHEATHAHLAKRGIRTTAALRPREERLCRKAELAFAQRLPDPNVVLAKLEAWRSVPDDFWSDAARARRAFTARFAAAKELGGPRWLTKGLRRLVAWRRARSRRAA